MVFALAKHARDDRALLGDAEALVRAQRLDVDRSGHVSRLSAAPVRVKGVGVLLNLIGTTLRLTFLFGFGAFSCPGRSTSPESCAARRNSERPSDSRH